MDFEPCSVTGAPAYAGFKDGFGSAGYGSDRDTQLFVDLTGALDGPVCDEVIDAAVARGDVRVYGSYMDGLSKASGIDAEVAARLFARGARDQAAQLASPEPSPTVDSIAVTIGSATCVSHVRQVPAPAWQASVFDLVRGSRDGMSPSDFRNLGRLWALTAAATGTWAGTDDPAMREASDAAHAHALAVEAAEEEARKDFSPLHEGWKDLVPVTAHSFVVSVRMPSPDAFDAAVEALGEAGCEDATVSTRGDGILLLDFDREARFREEALSSALRAVTRALPEDHVLLGVAFGGD